MQLINQLYIVAGAILGIAGLFAFSIIKSLYKQFKFRSEMKKGFKAEKEKLAKFKADGGMHKWVNNVAVTMPNGKVENTHVCEHTGYCPAVEGFVSISKIKQLVTAREQEKEFEEYKKSEIERIRTFYSIEKCDIDGLVMDILSIKKNFHIDKMNKFKEEIQKKLGKDVKIVTNIDELKDIVGDINDKS